MFVAVGRPQAAIRALDGRHRGYDAGMAEVNNGPPDSPLFPQPEKHAAEHPLNGS